MLESEEIYLEKVELESKMNLRFLAKEFGEMVWVKGREVMA